MDDDDSDGSVEERSSQVLGALLKALAAVAVIGIVVALCTTVLVRALGLNERDSPGPIGAEPAQPAEALPTTALPVPGEDSETPEPSEGPSRTARPHAGAKGDIELQVSPIRARPMERVNLTGTYKGADNLGLQVQRFEDGDWRDFGVDTTVRAGGYETYVQTGRAGEQRFRMFDPKAGQGSNVILVTIG